jgi:hypothetical protein
MSLKEERTTARTEAKITEKEESKAEQIALKEERKANKGKRHNHE